MAISLMFQCSCNKIFHLYFPRQKLFGEVLGITSVNWEEKDREEAVRQFESDKNAAELEGSEFIDSRETGQIKCSCGETFDPVEILQSRMISKAQEITTGVRKLVRTLKKGRKV